MDATLSRWGNSLGIRIPNQVALDLGFHAGSKVEIGTNNGQITIKPKYSLKDIYESHYHKPLSEITAEDVGKASEMDWGKDVGAEVLD